MLQKIFSTRENEYSNPLWKCVVEVPILVCDRCLLCMPCPACTRKTGECLDCGKPILPTSKRCKKCVGKILPRPAQNPKIDWPDMDLLIERVAVGGYCAVARELRCSDNAIRKRIRKAAASIQDPVATTLP